MKTHELYEKSMVLIEIGKIKQALMLTRKLLKNNPDNVVLKMQYAKLLTYDEKTRIRGIDIMIKIYYSDFKHNSLVELGKQAKLYGDFDIARYFFEEMVKTDKLASIYAILELINLDLLENKLDEAYKLLQENYTRLMNVIDNKVITNTDFYIRYKLGLLNDDDDKTKYYRRNLIKYSQNDVINHIKRHTNSFDGKKIHSQFSENIDIYVLLYNAKKLISNINPSYSTSVDIYYVNYGDVVGNVNDEETTYLEIVTYINTKNILTIYPISKEIVNDERYNKQKVKKI